ncbi:MAG: hypothetical protein WCG01_05545, partial [bacterium]
MPNDLHAEISQMEKELLVKCKLQNDKAINQLECQKLCINPETSILCREKECNSAWLYCHICIEQLPPNAIEMLGREMHAVQNLERDSHKNSTKYHCFRHQLMGPEKIISTVPSIRNKLEDSFPELFNEPGNVKRVRKSKKQSKSLLTEAKSSEPQQKRTYTKKAKKYLEDNPTTSTELLTQTGQQISKTAENKVKRARQKKNNTKPQNINSDEKPLLPTNFKPKTKQVRRRRLKKDIIEVSSGSSLFFCKIFKRMIDVSGCLANKCAMCLELNCKNFQIDTLVQATTSNSLLPNQTLMQLFDVKLSNWLKQSIAIDVSNLHYIVQGEARLALTNPFRLDQRVLALIDNLIPITERLNEADLKLIMNLPFDEQ